MSARRRSTRQRNQFWGVPIWDTNIQRCPRSPVTNDQRRKKTTAGLMTCIKFTIRICFSFCNNILSQRRNVSKFTEYAQCVCRSFKGKMKLIKSSESKFLPPLGAIIQLELGHSVKRIYFVNYPTKRWTCIFDISKALLGALKSKVLPSGWSNFERWRRSKLPFRLRKTLQMICDSINILFAKRLYADFGIVCQLMFLQIEGFLSKGSTCNKI